MARKKKRSGVMVGVKTPRKSRKRRHSAPAGSAHGYAKHAKVSSLRKQYNAAKSAYHRLGNALRKARSR
jgi:hypothetical protein